ncbi:MAG: MlaA family lipoprotein [Caulobacteraceae bacterium]
MSRPGPVFLALALTALAAGPAFAHARGDPFEKVNRAMFRFDLALDKLIFHPLAKIYRALTPGPIGKGIHNVITNLGEPLVFANFVLQARPKRAIAAAVRLGFNTTLGLGGLIDVVAKHDPHVNNGFADTLGRWGVGPGPYLVLPFLGPSSARDFLGSGVDAVTDPLHMINYPYRNQVNVARTGLGALYARAAAGDELEDLISQSADPYASLRSSYLQERAGEIHGLAVPASLPSLEGGEPQAIPETLPPIDESAAPPASEPLPSPADHRPDDRNPPSAEPQEPAWAAAFAPSIRGGEVGASGQEGF